MAEPSNAQLQFQSPTPRDVLLVKKILLEKARLPLELVDTIIDCAEYWPCTTTIRQTTPDTEITIRAGGRNENQFLLRSYPLGFVPSPDATSDYQMADQYQPTFPTMLPKPWSNDREVPNQSTEKVLQAWCRTSNPRTAHPCRKIVFKIISHDQGWGGAGLRGQYAGSYTWFDAGKEQLSAFTEGEKSYSCQQDPPSHNAGPVLEAWSRAPWPQFRLHDPNQHSSSVYKDVNSKLVCSLRTIVPESVPAPNTTPNAEDDDSSETTDSDDSSPNSIDQLNPGATEARTRNPPSNTAKSSRDYIFKHELCPEDDTLQKNVTASSEYRTHTITWSYKDKSDPKSPDVDEISELGRGKNNSDGEFVRNMQLGDCVTVWGKARFPGWVNFIREVEIKVYWAV